MLNFVKSKDGILIAFDMKGNGKELIIIGGSLSDHHDYELLSSELSKKLKVYNYDRRNRGETGPSGNHDLNSELQDLMALMDLCESPPVIYGHSSGAALAIRIAAKENNIKCLIISDLPYTPINGDVTVFIKKFHAESEEMRRLINSGDREAVVKFFLKDFGMDSREINHFLNTEQGRKACKYIETLLVDYEILGEGITPIDLLKKIQIPTLILTSKWALPISRDVAQELSICKIKILDQPLFTTPPSEIASEILQFLEYQDKQ